MLTSKIPIPLQTELSFSLDPIVNRKIKRYQSETYSSPTLRARIKTGATIKLSIVRL